jgi:hypothetical protein
MLEPLIRRFRRKSMDIKVREALETGIGLYHNHWEMIAPETPALRPDKAAKAVLDWCRETMASMRRPYGIDHVTFAVSLLDGQNQEVDRAGFGVLRPNDFYGDGTAVSQLEDVFQAWQSKGSLSRAQRLTAVMFSWGDMTRELLVAG